MLRKVLGPIGRTWIFVAVAVAVWAGVGYTQLTYSQTSVHQSDSMLLASNRSGLEICVESLIPEEVSVEDARHLTETAISQVRKHRDYRPAGLDVADPIVASGCPSPANLGNVNWDSKLGAAPVVEMPSAYRLFVFVANEQELAEAFGSRSPRTTAQEIFCEGNQCAEVTTAAYLTAKDLYDSRLLTTALTQGVGLLIPDSSESTLPPPGAEK